MDNRKHTRFPVQFRSSFSSVNMVSGSGMLGDLSIQGCRISSTTPVKTGTEMTLRIEISHEEPPIQISHAVARWSRAGKFGLEFVNFVEGEWVRFQKVVKELERHPYQQDTRDDSAV